MLEFSLEYFPPSDDTGLSSLLEQAKTMSAFNPLYMSVTHSAKDLPVNKTLNTVEFLKGKIPTRITPHLTCAPYSISEIMSSAREYQSIGIDSVVALRGHLNGDQDHRDPFFNYSPDFIQALNDEFQFNISISGYPEGHPEKIDDYLDFEYLKKKCDAGANEILTQWFFSNDYFYQYRDQCDEKGISIPVVPGILPISDIDKVKHFANVCGSRIPSNILEKFELIKGDHSDQESLGIEIAISQIEELHENGIDNFHLYTLNRSAMTERIIENFRDHLMNDSKEQKKRAS